MSREKPLLITIDGPAGAGKTTVSRELARRLGYTYVDTGALYRGVALAARRNGVAADDDEGLARLCQGLTIGFAQHRQGARLQVNGEDVAELIRTPEISMTASAVSARPVVRAFLLDLQRELGRRRAAVFEGRDMGSVVFPDADVKFFLSADLQTRALRRYQELGGPDGGLAQVKHDMARRDENDASRKLAPLVPAPDAVQIDSTDLSVDAVVAKMMEVIGSRVEKN